MISAIVLMVVGCGGDDGGVTKPPIENNDLPYTEADVTTTIPQEDSYVIQEFDSNNGTIVIDGASNYASDITVGSVLIGQNDNVAPNGFLRKVVSTSNENGSLVLQTVPALLTDAFEEMAISDTLQLHPSQIKSSKLFNGTTIIPDKDDETFSVALDAVLYDMDGNLNTTNDQIKMEGRYDFDLSIFTNIDISLFTLNKLEVDVITDQAVDLDLIAKYEWQFDEAQEFDIWQITLGAIPVGGVVWLVPTLKVEVHVHGDLTVTFETSITYTQEIRNGFGYDLNASPNFYPISDATKEFNFTPPTFTAEFDFEAGPSLDFSCLLYGVAGPYVSGKTGFHFQSELNADPCNINLNFDLEAIFYASVGLEMDTWVFDLDWHDDFEIYTHPIGNWNFPLSQTGTVVIDPSPDSINAPWSITGPCSYINSGNGDETLQELPVGQYTVTWDAVSGYTTPSSQTQSLVDGGTTTFSGTYTEIASPTGTIVINQIPNVLAGAGWSLTGPQNETGSGDATFAGMPLGQYTLTWDAVSGYTTPSSPGQSLVDGGTTTFSGTYTHSGTTNDGFILIPAGTFTMGSPSGELGRYFDEVQHQVTLTKSFWMSPYEVNEELWDSVMGSGTSTSQLPKAYVTWYNAVEFCNTLSVQDGLTPAYTGSGTTWSWNQSADGYRLPTEAEWEYACRAGSTTAFANGPITVPGYGPLDPNLDAMGWYYGNSDSQTHDVGGKQANAWGLYDMHGNVWEWCWDSWNGLAYSPDSVTDPVSPDPGSYRVLRGGSWYNNAQFCRSAARLYDYPGSGGLYVGFRLMRSAF